MQLGSILSHVCRRNAVWLLLCCCLYWRSPAVYAQQEVWVGLPSQDFNYFAAPQQRSQWCWAAAIQMVLNYYGIRINQEQIVARTYGQNPYNGYIPDRAGSIEAIHQNLNYRGVDAQGRRYQVVATMGRGAPVPLTLIAELEAGHPVIIGYRTGLNQGHAVVLTAAAFRPTPNGPLIHQLVIRDPDPNPRNAAQHGRVVLSAKELADHIDVYWYVRVY
ncbi:C39 family peptidase [Eisenibacter elegans]|uniref:C39 family peptidase n=1 Tax=Eisenibacter elegans TaxID=997 RepID=UPI0012B5A927|nr:papain-like cysteine protease family protein [Eisenibacter elegans]